MFFHFTKLLNEILYDNTKHEAGATELIEFPNNVYWYVNCFAYPQ